MLPVVYSVSTIFREYFRKASSCWLGILMQDGTRFQDIVRPGWQSF